MSERTTPHSEQGASKDGGARRACRWCGPDDDECLYTECHDLPDDEDHAPCGAHFPSEDDGSEASISPRRPHPRGVTMNPSPTAEGKARISARERDVLAALTECGEDFAYLNFKTIARRSGVEPYNVRRVTRSLARKGLAEFGRGLWTDDGYVAGSGYCATPAGRAALSPPVSGGREERRG